MGVSRARIAFRGLSLDGSFRSRVRYRLLGIAADEASFARRGFTPAEPSRQQRLEEIGRVFIGGYNAALRLADPGAMAPQFGDFAGEFRGFAFEGAAMGLALLDLLTPRRGQRFIRFAHGPASRHVYMAYVGAGWALARTSLRLAWRFGPLDPMLRWLVIDGYGFHAGYFHHRDTIERQLRPRALQGHAENVFDQGLGRAVWFVKGADIGAVAGALGAFPQHRQADLWSGAGLAAAYAGGVGDADLAALFSAAEPFQPELGQGAAFAAKARERAGNPAEHTDRACRVFCGMDAAAAAATTDDALDGLDLTDTGAAFTAWRGNIRKRIGVRPGKEPSQ
jgi:hypothetical protein